MCRSELFDKTLEKEREFMKEKKLIDSRNIKYKIFKRQTFPLHMITYSFLFYLSLEGRYWYPNNHLIRSKSTSL